MIPTESVALAYVDQGYTGEQPAEAAGAHGTALEVEAISVLTVWVGRPAFQVVSRDLSAHRHAQAALRFQAALVDHVSDAIVATTADGLVTAWNPAAEQIYRALTILAGHPYHRGEPDPG